VKLQRRLMLPEDALSFLVEYVQSQTAVTHKAGLVTSCYNSLAGSQTAKLSELIFMKVRQLLMLISIRFEICLSLQ